MGRPRKPNALKILDGDQPCRINTAEPVSPKGIGLVPELLDDLGREEWSRLVPKLERMKLLGEIDSHALTLYCMAYSRWRRAEAALVRDGMTIENTIETEVTTRTGSRTTTRSTVKVNPMVRVADESHRQMVRLLARFGMTPSDRASLHVEAAGGEDKLLAFLANRNRSANPRGRRPGKD